MRLLWVYYNIIFLWSIWTSIMWYSTHVFIWYYLVDSKIIAKCSQIWAISVLVIITFILILSLLILKTSFLHQIKYETNLREIVQRTILKSNKIGRNCLDIDFFSNFGIYDRFYQSIICSKPVNKWLIAMSKFIKSDSTNIKNICWSWAIETIYLRFLPFLTDLLNNLARASVRFGRKRDRQQKDLPLFSLLFFLQKYKIEFKKSQVQPVATVAIIVR